MFNYMLCSDVSAHLGEIARLSKQEPEQLLKQKFVLALQDKQTAGFMAYRDDYVPDILAQKVLSAKTFYVFETFACEEYRKYDIERAFYQILMGISIEFSREILVPIQRSDTRNIGLLTTLGFEEMARALNSPGHGQDTSYFKLGIEAW